ncbi:MAG: hypothetical protein ACE3K2_13570 [Paenibacillus sp.]|uniref:hypothetical protein n=1 Tax=Paenibacillus sp. TaxID=58172 RepID=UPI003B7F6ABC
MNYGELRSKYGSPLYIYDLNILRQSCNRLKDALPEPSMLYYSLKANPHPAIVKQLLDMGCRAEVSSLGELNSVLEAGGLPRDVLYTGPGKSKSELKVAVAQGVQFFSAESMKELERLRSVVPSGTPPIQVIMRINPDQGLADAGLAMTGTPSQFGTDEQKLLRELKEVQECDEIRIAGFHIFNGSNTANAERLAESFLSSIQVIARISKETGIPLQFVDLGGGFGHPYAVSGTSPDFSGIKVQLETALDEHMPGWRTGEPAIAYESGRYLSAACGVLVSSVTDIKESKGSHFIVLDSGIHHLGGMAGLGRIPRVQYDIMPVTEKSDPYPESTHVVGPLCTPLDFFNKKAIMPSLQLEEQVYVPNVGAYGITASLLGFLSRDIPVEIVVDEGNVKHVSQLALTRRTHLNEMYEGRTIHEHRTN